MECVSDYLNSNIEGNSLWQIIKTTLIMIRAQVWLSRYIQQHPSVAVVRLREHA